MSPMLSESNSVGAASWLPFQGRRAVSESSPKILWSTALNSSAVGLSGSVNNSRHPVSDEGSYNVGGSDIGSKGGVM